MDSILVHQSLREFENKIIVKEFESYDQYNLIYKHNTLTPKTVRKYLDKAYKKYYSRPNWVLNL